MYTLQEWLRLDNQEIARLVSPSVSTAVVYLNGTRRWFISQNRNWSEYVKITAAAQRALSQLFYDHGIWTLVQPVLGYDLLARGQNYLQLAMEQGLTEMAGPDYRAWYRRAGIQVSFYGNWTNALAEVGFPDVVRLLSDLVAETHLYQPHKLLLGVFADEGLERIVTLAKEAAQGEELLKRYYGQAIGPVDLIVGSGQPAIWDLPLLDINKASIYFLQAPTFCLTKETLRLILYDHLYERVNDDDLYENVRAHEWQDSNVLGLGQRTRKGWIAA